MLCDQTEETNCLETVASYEIAAASVKALPTTPLYFNPKAKAFSIQIEPAGILGP